VGTVKLGVCAVASGKRDGGSMGTPTDVSSFRVCEPERKRARCVNKKFGTGRVTCDFAAASIDAT